MFGAVIVRYAQMTSYHSWWYLRTRARPDHAQASRLIKKASDRCVDRPTAGRGRSGAECAHLRCGVADLGFQGPSVRPRRAFAGRAPSRSSRDARARAVALRGVSETPVIRQDKSFEVISPRRQFVLKAIRGWQRAFAMASRTTSSWNDGTGKSATTAWLIEELRSRCSRSPTRRSPSAAGGRGSASCCRGNAVVLSPYCDYYQRGHVPQTDAPSSKSSSINLMRSSGCAAAPRTGSDTPLTRSSSPR